MRSYTCAVKQGVQFLRDTEVRLVPPHGSAGLCCERLGETQKVMDSMEQHFQTHVDQLQATVPLHPYLSPQEVEHLQEVIVSQLLVRMSTVKAMGQVQLERLTR